MTSVLVALSWAGALLATWPERRNLRLAGVRSVDSGTSRGRATGSPSSPLVRLLLCVAAGGCLGLLVAGPSPGALGWGGAAACVVWWLLRRAPLAQARRQDRAVARDLPFLVLLLAAGLRAGASASSALRVAQEACPGPAADRLRPLTARLAWGVDPSEVWQELARDPALGLLGRRLERSQRTGASVAQAVADLAEELAARRRSEVEDLARGVGVRAALPLGLCLLPAFVLLGIVPVVASLFGQLAWG